MNAQHPHSQSRGRWVDHAHRFLFDPSHRSGHARRFENFIAWVIIFSVVAIFAEHVEAIHLAHADLLQRIDLVCVAIFSVEYLLRVWVAPVRPEYQGKSFARLRYMASPYALIDFIAIFPFYLTALVGVDLAAMQLLRLVRLLRILKLTRNVVPAWREFQALNEGRSFRAKLYALMEPTGHSGQLRTYVDNFIVFWVLLSIVCVVLESVESIHKVLALQFILIDSVAFGIFTVEYLIRLYTAPENPRFKKAFAPHAAYVFSPQAIIDLLAILPFLLEVIWPNQIDLRFLRVFRLARLLKLTRYTTATVTLYKVLRREWQVIFASVFIMLLLIVLAASMGYLLEHESQPDKFENIPQAIYWAVITLASVGYGDISPVTPWGRALTVVLSLVGVGIFAIPAGLLASAFTDQLRIDRDEFKRQLLEDLQAGDNLPTRKAAIAEESERLHLSTQDIRRLQKEAQAEFDQKQREQAQGGLLVIDPEKHPQLLIQQASVLCHQLDLLAPLIEPAQAIGAKTTHSHAKTDARHPKLDDVLAVLRDHRGQAQNR
jgi:voltage-gated potassium channel Kch